MWNERLVSAFEQSRQGLKELFEHGTKSLDIGGKPITEDEWNKLSAVVKNPNLNYQQVSRDLHCVLQDKCEDPEGLVRIRAAKGNSIRADFDMYSWYLGRSGQELQSRAEFIMHPPVPKTEGEIAAIIDKWREQYEFVKNYASNLSLPSPFLRAALKSMMIGNAREYFEQLVDKEMNDQELIERAFDYATRESRRN